MLKNGMLRNALVGLVLIGSPVAAQNDPATYAADRSEIENLSARYLLALDSRDADTYADTFTEDGVLVYARGELKGREAIRQMVGDLRERAQAAQAEQSSSLRPSRGRHNITNHIIEMDGNRARSRSYWTSVNNNNPERRAEISAYGHYEDELVKENGRWLFTRREVFNEQLDHRAAAGAPTGGW